MSDQPWQQSVDRASARRRVIELLQLRFEPGGRAAHVDGQIVGGAKWTQAAADTVECPSTGEAGYAGQDIVAISVETFHSQPPQQLGGLRSATLCCPLESMVPERLECLLAHTVVKEIGVESRGLPRAVYDEADRFVLRGRSVRVRESRVVLGSVDVFFGRVGQFAFTLTFTLP